MISHLFTVAIESLMEVRLTEHAEKQLAYRELDRQQVIQVAREPEQIVQEADAPSIAQSRVNVHGKIYLIRVAFRDEDEVRFVITADRISKVSKYWQES